MFYVKILQVLKLYQFIIDFITLNAGVTQEYELLKFIEEKHPDFFDSLGTSPTLYRKHFFLFHQLYLLNDELNKNSSQLKISVLEISISHSVKGSPAIGEIDHLKSFYLNKQNLYLSEDEILNMKKMFWKKYVALDKKADAIKLLELENIEPLDKKIIKQQYNRLANQHHPDRGGEQAQFIAIKQAYEELKRLFI